MVFLVRSPRLVRSKTQNKHGVCRKAIKAQYGLFKFKFQWMEEKDGQVTKLELIEVKERMGRMRKSVPTLPLIAACVLCFLNFVLPSIGKTFHSTSNELFFNMKDTSLYLPNFHMYAYISDL